MGRCGQFAADDSQVRQAASASESAEAALGRQFGALGAFDTAATAYQQCQAAAKAETESAMGANFTTVAEAMRQHEALGYATTVADAYRQAQYPQQTELEKTIALMSGSVGTAMLHFDRASADTALGLYHHPTSREMFEQIERERLEKSLVEMERHERIIEFTPPPIYDYQAAENRRLDREREHRLETERLAVLVRLETEQEFEARKQVSKPMMTEPAAQPVQRSAAQDAAILATLKTMSVDPLAVPKNSPGKPGTKAKVRTALDGNPLFTGATVFDKAWERLAKRGEIVIRA